MKISRAVGVSLITLLTLTVLIFLYSVFKSGNAVEIKRLVIIGLALFLIKIVKLIGDYREKGRPERIRQKEEKEKQLQAIKAYLIEEQRKKEIKNSMPVVREEQKMHKLNKRQLQLTVAWIKNNRILIILWLMGIAICATFLLYPKRYFISFSGSQFFLAYPRARALPVIQWGYIIPICLSILIIGALLIYTLRDKKKKAE